jgi:hypothetical protein
MTNSSKRKEREKRHNHRYGLKYLTKTQNRSIKNLRNSFINLGKGGYYGMESARNNLTCLLEQFTTGKLTPEGARAGSFLGNSISRIRRIKLDENRSKTDAERVNFVSLCRKKKK